MEITLLITKLFQSWDSKGHSTSSACLRKLWVCNSKAVPCSATWQMCYMTRHSNWRTEMKIYSCPYCKEWLGLLPIHCALLMIKIFSPVWDKANHFVNHHWVLSKVMHWGKDLASTDISRSFKFVKYIFCVAEIGYYSCNTQAQKSS